ncbi:hypothetical protein QMZ05_00190 [Bradyrhizobium sp. INPA03-11B]|uniref:hypothetical protein n=1 Tax=Bradyrhizobium sp. INPA03-11B TaxID=418598 RepID=UPI00338FBF15
MWQLFLDEFARRLLLQAVKGEGLKAFRELFHSDLSKPEAYADRIKREFGLHNYAQARALYDSNRDYWEELYGDDPLNSRNHPASPPQSLLPRNNARREWPDDYYNLGQTNSGAFGRFGTGGQFSPGSATSSQPLYETLSLVAPPDSPSQASRSDGSSLRRLVRIPLSGEEQNAFDAGAPAMPFAPPGSMPPSGRPATFDERFPASAPPAGTPSDAMRPLSPFSGQPMRFLPPSVFGFPEKPEVPETDFDDWLAGLIRPRPRQ